VSIKRYLALMTATRKAYRAVGRVFCPALNDQVYFDDAGWRHLLYKDRGRRPIADQIRRFKLLNRAVKVISEADVESESRTTKSNGQVRCFWPLEMGDEDLLITVIVRQINHGRKHFYSVMDKKRREATTQELPEGSS
jgi:hypothetical protein